jgi:Cytochrome P450
VVTLLFTDPVASTELLARVGDAAAEELRRVHFGLLRTAIGGSGGQEVKTLGDGVMAAFTSSPRPSGRRSPSSRPSMSTTAATRARCSGCGSGSMPASPSRLTTSGRGSSTPSWGCRRRSSWPDLVTAKRHCPGDDVLSLLVERHAGGDLDTAELSATVILLLGAGVVTTTNLIGNGLLALLHHRPEMDRLWADPTVVDSAVEEMLRYDTPVQLVTRQVLADVEVEGAYLRQDENVVVLLGAANRDPASFPEPDVFDISRPDNGHLAFAWGSHFCLGARLARLEAQLVFAGLRRRFARLDLAGEPRRRPGLALRGLDSLPLTVTPR